MLPVCRTTLSLTQSKDKSPALNVILGVAGGRGSSNA